MNGSQIDTGVLYREDNLAQLTQLPSESVNLIYLDPPFFSNRRYEVVWGDEAEVRSFEDRWAGGIMNYIDWMCERITEMFRVLRPNGALYLHCDPHASHYLKVMLDEVFGQANFRNEIVWKRTGAHGAAKRYAPVHDLILYYIKPGSAAPTWNKQYTPYSTEYVDDKYRHEDDLGRYQLITLFPDGSRQGETGTPWRGIDPTAKGLHWRYRHDKLEELDGAGMIYWPPSGKGLPRLKRYLDKSQGVAIQDVWTDVSPLNSRARERLGYPTQKPLVLLERIIRASSNPGDVVLDPFCGCGTTIAAAHNLGRQWIGIDISPTALTIMDRRMRKLGVTPTIVNAPSTAADLKALKPFEFQNWVINAMNGSHSPRKVGDMGIDGYSFFARDPIQVKQSEHVGRNVVDNFETAMRRGTHDTGYIVAFSFTRGAVEEVARAKTEGLNIRLVKVAEVILLVKRPGSQPTNLGPQPATIEELPLPPVRKPLDLPSAGELIASDLSNVG